MIARVAILAVASAALSCSAPALLPELEKAERLEREGRSEAALAAYERAARTCQEIDDRRRRRARCAEAHLYRAELLDRLGRRRRAVGAYLDVPTRVADDESAARATYRAARILLDLGEDARAYDLLWRTIADYPNELAASDAVDLVVRDGRRRAPRELVRALRELWGALAAADVAPDLVFAMADVAEAELEDPRAALSLYDDLSARYPGASLHPEALWRAARLARQLGDPRGAIDRYQRLLATQEDLPFGFGSTRSEHLDDALLDIARVYREDLCDYDSSLAALRRLPERFEHSRLHDDAMYERALTWAAAGEPARACGALAELADKWPDSRHQLERAPALRAELGC